MYHISAVLITYAEGCSRLKTGLLYTSVFYAYPCTCVTVLRHTRICMFIFLYVNIISWAFIVVHSIKVHETAVREKDPGWAGDWKPVTHNQGGPPPAAAESCTFAT